MGEWEDNVEDDDNDDDDDDDDDGGGGDGDGDGDGAAGGGGDDPSEVTTQQCRFFQANLHHEKLH